MTRLLLLPFLWFWFLDSERQEIVGKVKLAVLGVFPHELEEHGMASRVDVVIVHHGQGDINLVEKVARHLLRQSLAMNKSEKDLA